MFRQHYMPPIIAEYERIGIAAEMERYFTASNGVPTVASFEAELATLRATPSGIGFDAYCARVGMDASVIRALYERMQSQLRG